MNIANKRCKILRIKIAAAKEAIEKSVVTTALLATTFSPVATKAAENHSNDSKNSQTTELTTDTNFYNFPASLRPDNQGYFDFEDVQKMALEMYAQSINNYLEAYIAEATADVNNINKAKKQGKNYNVAISSAIDKNRINNLRLHCAEAGSWELFMQKFTPQFLMDSVYKQFKNPNYAPTIFDDLKEIAQKYSDNYSQFFMEKNGNIYQKVTNYNKNNNPSNDSKLFLCEETNNGGRHFTVLYYNGASYQRVSFNKEDVHNVNDYAYAQTRIGVVVDVTGIFASYVTHELKKLEKEGNKIPKNNVVSFMEKLSNCLSSDTYYISSQEQLAQLENLTNNNSLFAKVDSNLVNVELQELSEAKLELGETHHINFDANFTQVTSTNEKIPPSNPDNNRLPKAPNINSRHRRGRE